MRRVDISRQALSESTHDHQANTVADTHRGERKTASTTRAQEIHFTTGTNEQRTRKEPIMPSSSTAANTGLGRKSRNGLYQSGHQSTQKRHEQTVLQ